MSAPSEWVVEVGIEDRQPKVLLRLPDWDPQAFVFLAAAEARELADALHDEADRLDR